MTQGRQVIGVAVVQRAGEVLVGERPAGVPLAGYAEFPGGKCRPGESPEQAACRECLEETGLEVRLSGCLRSVEHAYPHGVLELHFFAGVPRDADAEPRPPFRWVRREALTQLQFPPANESILRDLAK